MIRLHRDRPISDLWYFLFDSVFHSSHWIQPMTLAPFRSFRSFATLGICLVFVGCTIFSFGSLRSRVAGAFKTRSLPELETARTTFQINDGRSVCFEFGTHDEKPFWVILQRFSSASDQRTRTLVLTSQKPSFDDYQVIGPQSNPELDLLSHLQSLSIRVKDDPIAIQDLTILARAIKHREDLSWCSQPWPPL